MAHEMVPVADGFAVCEKPANVIIVGQMIKFDSGIYKVNKTETLPPDIELVAIDVITVWVKWKGKRPVEHRITQPGQQHSDRDDLPDQNKAEWEIGLDGQARRSVEEHSVLAANRSFNRYRLHLRYGQHRRPPRRCGFEVSNPQRALCAS